jgi:hypothetical protein
MESYPLFAAQAFATGIAWLVSGIAIYKLAEERGRRKGYIDQRIV